MGRWTRQTDVIFRTVTASLINVYAFQLDLLLLSPNWSYWRDGGNSYTNKNWEQIPGAQLKPISKPFLNLRSGVIFPTRKKKHSQHTKKLGSLGAMIMKISQSDRVEDHIQIMCESLKIMHWSKPKPQKFLSTVHLKLFFSYLNPIPEFVKPRPKYDEH